MDSWTTTLSTRDDSTSTGMSPTLTNLIIALMTLIFLALLLLLALCTIRRVRRNRAVARHSLPLHNSPPLPSSKNHKRERLIITATPYGRNSAVYHLYDGKSAMMQDTPPHSPDSVPEIRITFPDEQDESGRRKSGRVVVVRVGDTSVGLEPLDDGDEEQLPAYEKEAGGRFQSIDMDRIGGLKEKKEWL